MYTVIVLYALCLFFIFIYSLSQAQLVWAYLRRQLKVKEGHLKQLPQVTIQLPLYNEKYVVQRLLQTVAHLDYPADLLQVQVLDDSSDETTAIVEAYQFLFLERGIELMHHRRSNRKGYKAGALAEGLTLARGEFIAIFDADFLPEPDFLYKTLPYFEDQQVGMVQTRWGHLNRNSSLLTHLQAFALDAHFIVEQVGRNTLGAFINFNGTAGIWRKTCIQQAGGWQDDTLTEDLDLSYRAQLQGWQFIYLKDVVSPAELPPVMSALKSQQFRWTKGGAETARKHLKKVFMSKVSLRTKWLATMHLLNSSVFLAILGSAVLSLPLLWFKVQHPLLQKFFDLSPVFFTGFIIVAAVYFTAHAGLYTRWPQRYFDFLWKFPLFLIFSMGLSLHNSIAVMEGFLGIKPLLSEHLSSIYNSIIPMGIRIYI